VDYSKILGVIVLEVKILKNVMHANKRIANNNRELFKERNILAVNIMASPGAGKTSLIKQIINHLKDRINLFVIEGDIASSIDAQKIEALGIPVVQINTGGGCHLDANMINLVVSESNVLDNSILLIENVGNLVCPSTFDLGENIKLLILSTAEGDDKPYKYVSMFECADVIILNKMDIIEHIEFDKNFFYKGVRAVNSSAPIIEVSCRTGSGIPEFIEYISNQKE
jgi:hydrogenase nickel incorporation protein HypB